VIRVVTDGAADLPDAVAEQSGIAVVRGQVMFAGSEWTGDNHELWQNLERSVESAHRRRLFGGDRPVAMPSTKAPTVEQLRAAYDTGGEVIAVHVSGELSRTCANAAKAAAGLPGRVRVVDTRSLSVGTAMIAIGVSEALQAGCEANRAVETAASWVDQLHVHALIDDVTLLVHGGRAGLLEKTSDFHGHRHIMAVKGHAIPIRKVRSRSEAIRELIAHVREHVGDGVTRWAVGHGDAADVGEFSDRLASVFGCDPWFVTEVGPPVGSHFGPRCLVVGFLAAG